MVWEEESIEVTEEAKIVACEISQRGCVWTDGYENSFAYDMDTISYFKKDAAIYLAGSKDLKAICGKIPYNPNHPVWQELNLSPKNKKDIDNIRYLCEKIIKIMRS